MATFAPAEIVERIDITEHLMVMRLRPRAPIPFRAGQFVRIGLEIDGRILQRSYSLVNAPGEDLLEFLFELVPQGKLTPRIWELGSGDSLLVHEQAAGVFVLDPEAASRYLLAATATGIAPFVSMVRALARDRASWEGAELLLLHAADHPTELAYYADELKEAAAGGWLSYVPIIGARAEHPAWDGEVGWIEDLLRKYMDARGHDHLTSIAYASGHPVMVDNVKKILTRAGYPKGRIKVEPFFPLRAVLGA